MLSRKLSRVCLVNLCLLLLSSILLAWSWATPLVADDDFEWSFSRYEKNNDYIVIEVRIPNRSRDYAKMVATIPEIDAGGNPILDSKGNRSQKTFAFTNVAKDSSGNETVEWITGIGVHKRYYYVPSRVRFGSGASMAYNSRKGYYSPNNDVLLAPPRLPRDPLSQ